MTAVTELLLETLDDLGDEELKTFKWFLQQAEILEDFPAIPRSRLEKADKLDTLDLIVQTYNEQSVEVAKKVLKKINRNDLVQSLSNSSEPKRKSSHLQCDKNEVLKSLYYMNRSYLLEIVPDAGGISESSKASSASCPPPPPTNSSQTKGKAFLSFYPSLSFE